MRDEQTKTDAAIRIGASRGLRLGTIRMVADRYDGVLDPVTIRGFVEGAKEGRFDARGNPVEPNGLAPGIIQISNRRDGRYGIVLIDLDFFALWLDSKRLEPLPEVAPHTQQQSPPSEPLVRTSERRRKCRAMEIP